MKKLFVISLVIAFSLTQSPGKIDLRLADAYKGCDSIKDIHFEGVCSSSWAITVASVATDVLCAFDQKQTEKKFLTKRISYQNIIECCSECYNGFETGCYGGSFVKAMNYLQVTGAVTGTGHPSNHQLANQFCKNYKLKACYQNPKSTTKCEESDFSYAAAVGTCDKKCDNTNQNYTTDINKITSFNTVDKGANTLVAAMESQLTQNNILITEMTIFEDIYSYKKDDVYIHLYGRSIGTLTVAIIGYDTDTVTGFGYWIVRFPWGSEFGDGGFVKIQRGTNNSGIENQGNVYYLTKTA